MKLIMREVVKDFVRVCSKTLPIAEPIYEFGSLQVKGQEGFADLRPLFIGKTFVGADMCKGTGVDVILDLHSIDLPSNTVGTVLIIDTLEHVEFIERAMKEVYRILKPNGVIVITSVMNFIIHKYPCDYWRFTPQSFKSLLKPFTYSFVESIGEKNFPHTVVGVGCKGEINREAIKDFEEKAFAWKKKYDRWTFNKVAKLFVPPLFLKLRQKLLKKQENKTEA